VDGLTITAGSPRAQAASTSRSASSLLHVGQGPDRLFIDRRAVGARRQRCHRAGVDDASHAEVRGRREHDARAFDVGAVDVGGRPRVEAIVGRAVEDLLAVGHRAPNRRGVRHVTFDSFDAQIRQQRRAAAGPHQAPHPAPGSDQRARDVRAHEPRRARDEGGHHGPPAGHHGPPAGRC
jgi:hypothetical protein